MGKSTLAALAASFLAPLAAGPAALPMMMVQERGLPLSFREAISALLLVAPFAYAFALLPTVMLGMILTLVSQSFPHFRAVSFWCVTGLLFGAIIGTWIGFPAFGPAAGAACAFVYRLFIGRTFTPLNPRPEAARPLPPAPPAATSERAPAARFRPER